MPTDAIPCYSVFITLMFPGYFLEAITEAFLSERLHPKMFISVVSELSFFSPGPGVLLLSIMSIWPNIFPAHTLIWDRTVVHLLSCFSVGLCLDIEESSACQRGMWNTNLNFCCGLNSCAPLFLHHLLVLQTIWSVSSLCIWTRLIFSFKAFWEMFVRFLLACLKEFLHQILLFSIFLIWK